MSSVGVRVRSLTFYFLHEVSKLVLPGLYQLDILSEVEIETKFIINPFDSDVDFKIEVQVSKF